MKKTKMVRVQKDSPDIPVVQQKMSCANEDYNSAPHQKNIIICKNPVPKTTVSNTSGTVPQKVLPELSEPKDSGVEDLCNDFEFKVSIVPVPVKKEEKPVQDNIFDVCKENDENKENKENIANAIALKEKELKQEEEKKKL